MRDIVVTLLVFGSLPLILRKPFFGVLVWTWLGLMNPHRLCWGFAVTMPFAQIVAITLLASLLIAKNEPKKIPWTGVSIILATWWGWMLFTSIFALNPPAAWEQFDKVSKIMLMVFVTMMMVTSRERIQALVWTMALSLGIYGVKGGIFTLAHGGVYHVQGPFGTFIGGSNEIGLALLMTIPLLRYLQLSSESFWVKRGMLASIGLCLLSVLGTQSRGDFLGLGAMSLYLIMKSRKKLPLLVALAVFIPAGYFFMPESWHARMSTIETYKQDQSAEGRINAWWTAYNVAVARPLVGGGYDMFVPWVFRQYAPNPDNIHDVHSIYFEALGEHGFIGFCLFLGLGLAAILASRSIVRGTKNDPRLFWMRDLASMIHVSLIGYASAGAFLGLGYFDFYYALLAVLVGLQRLLRIYQAEAVPEVAPQAVDQRLATGKIPAYATARKEVHLKPRRGLGLGLTEWFAKL